jgi:peroxiredoxin
MEFISATRLLHPSRSSQPRRGEQPFAEREVTEDSMTLQAKLDAFKADFEAGKPPYSVPRSVIDTMHRATEELIASGAATRALKAGYAAPPFVQEDPDGKPVSAAELLAQGPLVISFYRGVWCPYCNNATAAAFGLRFVLPDYLIELYKSLKNDLPAFNGDTSWTLPMPGRFVIGQDRVIRYAEVNPDYTQRPEPADMLPVLRRLTAKAA